METVLQITTRGTLQFMTYKTDNNWFTKTDLLFSENTFLEEIKTTNYHMQLLYQQEQQEENCCSGIEK